MACSTGVVAYEMLLFFYSMSLRSQAVEKSTESVLQGEDTAKVADGGSELSTLKMEV